MTEDIWLWAGAGLLFVASVIIALAGGTATNAQTARTSLHASVCLIAAVAYALMATGYGRIEAAAGSVLVVRYIDWSITTPLLLIALSVTATPVGRAVPGLIAALVFADVAMIVTGLLAAASEGASAWLWFGASSLAFAMVLFILWVPLREVAEEGNAVRREIYVRHAGILTALWALYPVVFLFGAEGPQATGVFGVATTTALFAILDVAAKAGFGALVVFEDERLVRHEREEAGWSSAAVAGPRGATEPGAGPLGPAPRPATSMWRGGAGAPSAPAPGHPSKDAAEAEPLSAAPRVEGATRGTARDAALQRYYAALRRAPSAFGRPLTAAELTTWLRARGIDARRYAASLPVGTHFRVVRRRPVAPPPEAVAPSPRRKRTRKPPPWPIGALDRSDAVPVAIATAVLLAIAWAPRDRR